jgi:hypothetical protein
MRGEVQNALLRSPLAQRLEELIAFAPPHAPLPMLRRLTLWCLGSAPAADWVALADPRHLPSLRHLALDVRPGEPPAAILRALRERLADRLVTR